MVVDTYNVALSGHGDDNSYNCGVGCVSGGREEEVVVVRGMVVVVLVVTHSSKSGSTGMEIMHLLFSLLIQ